MPPRQRRRPLPRRRRETYYASCDDARAAGVGRSPAVSPATASALDPNDNGVACEGTVGVGRARCTSVSSVISVRSAATGRPWSTRRMAYLGTTYAWGGGNSSGPSLGIRDGGVADRYGDYNKIGFDCSGLALYAWAQVGVVPAALLRLPVLRAAQGLPGQPAAGRPGVLRATTRPTRARSTTWRSGSATTRSSRRRTPASYVKISTMYWNGFIGARPPRRLSRLRPDRHRGIDAATVPW